MIILAKEIPLKLASAAKIIDALTVNEQTNAAGKISEKIIDSLTKLATEDKISTDLFLEKINNLSVNKKFGLLRGNMKEIKIKLGDTSAKDA